jgi:hypothetical protein
LRREATIPLLSLIEASSSVAMIFDCAEALFASALLRAPGRDCFEAVDERQAANTQTKSSSAPESETHITRRAPPQRARRAESLVVKSAVSFLKIVSSR